MVEAILHYAASNLSPCSAAIFVVLPTMIAACHIIRKTFGE